MYPPTTFKSLAGDSSSESFARPSRKRCRSFAATMTSSIHATRVLVPSRVDLLPPRKRFRDFISPEDNVEEDTDTEVLVDIETDAMAVEVAEDRDIMIGVDACIGMEVDVGVDVEDTVENEVESSDRGTMEVGVDVVVGIDIPDAMLMPDAIEHLEEVVEGHRELESRSLIAAGERASLLEQVASLDRSNSRLRGTMMMERVRADRRLETFAVRHLVEEALAAYEATRAANDLEAESQNQNGSDGNNGNGRNGNGGNGNGGNRNGRDGNGGNGNPNKNNMDARPIVRECTYQDFMKCQSLNFKGTEGVIRLTRWFEKIETVFHISNCLEKYQVKYATCTLLNNALTWWNSHKKTIGTDAAFSITHETPRFRIDNNLMDQKLKGYAVKNAKNKRRLEVNHRDNRGKQPPFKRPNVRSQNVARTYTAGKNERKPYNGPLPLCNKCKLHHEGPCTMRRGKCNKCGRQGHYRSDCPKLNDQNHGNKAGNKNRIGKARGKAYVLGGRDANPDSNVVKGTFLLNNHYAFVLFDLDVDRIFVLTTFSTLLDVTPNTLDVSYAVELADERISETNTILKGRALGLLGHPFNIDPMLVELGSVDVIIGMDCQGDRGGKGEKSKLIIISCTKTKKYIKREVFPEDLLGLPPMRQVEFPIDLVPGAAPVA
ncbi:reverse transcriptase domain-containing protein [Tanacetum coccineum]